MMVANQRKDNFLFLDQTQSAKILAEAIRESYQDLFRVNIKANELTRQDVINKFKTLGQGQLSDSVLEKMAMTFTSLVKLADFESSSNSPVKPVEQEEYKAEPKDSNKDRAGLKIGGLIYNIQIVLPDSRDPAVYDALFSSLRKHLS